MIPTSSVIFAAKRAPWQDCAVFVLYRVGTHRGRIHTQSRRMKPFAHKEDTQGTSCGCSHMLAHVRSRASPIFGKQEMAAPIHDLAHFLTQARRSERNVSAIHSSDMQSPQSTAPTPAAPHQGSERDVSAIHSSAINAHTHMYRFTCTTCRCRLVQAFFQRTRQPLIERRQAPS